MQVKFFTGEPAQSHMIEVEINEWLASQHGLQFHSAVHTVTPHYMPRLVVSIWYNIQDVKEGSSAIS